MSKKQAAILLDISIIACATLCLFLLGELKGLFRVSAISAVLLAAGTLLIFELACWYKKPIVKKGKHSSITTVILLGEKENPLRVWDLTGKIGLIIGKSSEEYSVDIDLSDTDFSTYIDTEHALLNYNGSGWWLEDVSVQNGVSVIRNDRELLLGHHVPIALLPGDIVCIANYTRLAVN